VCYLKRVWPNGWDGVDFLLDTCDLYHYKRQAAIGVNRPRVTARTTSRQCFAILRDRVVPLHDAHMLSDAKAAGLENEGFRDVVGVQCRLS